MSAALPTIDGQCCLPVCEDVVIQNIPGPTGGDGTDGTDGEDGVSAVTTLTVAFTMPAEAASAAATMASTAGLVIGENVFVQSLGTLQVTAIGSAITATLKNIEDTAGSLYLSNAAPGTVAAIGSRVGMTGLQGAAGLLAGAAAGGNLKGTFPNPLLLIPNALGALAVGNGTDANSLSAGSNGQIPAYDSTQPLGLLPKSIIPITGGTDVAVDRIVRLSAATGLPIPLESSKASLKDTGVAGGLFVADASTGNTRGTDAVDFQVNRPAVGATAVASGSQSVIMGGQDNKVSALRSAVVSGENNLITGEESFIGDGDSNQIDSAQCVIGGGGFNTILGGTSSQSVIAGGDSNAITVQYGAVLGGASNAVSGAFGAVLGGTGNIVSGIAAAVSGGRQASADKYGQRAFSAGRFAAQADCQQSDLIWRIATTTNTANVESFLDGATLRAVVPTGKTWAFDILCVGRSDAGVSAAWTVKGAIQNIAGVVTLVGAGVTAALLGDGSGGTWGAVGNVPLVDADDPNNALRIRVTGALTTNIRWTMHARIMEVAY